MKKYKIMVLLFTLFHFSLSHSMVKNPPSKPVDEKNPLGCRDMGYEYKLKALKLLISKEGDLQSLFLLYNRLYKPVTLYHMLGKESTRGVYLNQTIQPRQWAVLSAGDEFRFICTTPALGQQYGNIVDCKDAVKVCEYARVKYGVNNRGNFWMVSSTSRNAAVNGVTWYGVIPR